MSHDRVGLYLGPFRRKLPWHCLDVDGVGICRRAVRLLLGFLACIHVGWSAHAQQFSPTVTASPSQTIGLATRGLLDQVKDQKRVALVIGNGDYQSVSRLPNPANDAADIAAALEALGFDVHHVDHVGKSAMEAALADFSDNAVGADIALVFYAGHGIEVGGQNYLIPTDAKLETDRRLLFESVSLDYVMASLEAVKGVRIVLLDACRNNPFASSMRMSSSARSVGRGLSRVEATSGTLISFAAKEGTVADDGDGRNSPFTSALLATLGEPGIEIGILFRMVRDSVLRATHGTQEPYVSASLSSDPVYLVPPLPAARAETPAVAEPQSSPPPASDEAARAWDVTKDISSPAVLRTFASRYEGTVYAEFALARLKEIEEEAAQSRGAEARPAEPDPTQPQGPALASLPATSEQQARILDPAELARAVQIELARVGCEPGQPDGKWGSSSRRAIESFNASTKLALASASPSADMLEKLKSFTGRVCPLSCGPRYNAVGDACVLKSCPQGQTLTRNGACVDRTASTVNPTQPSPASASTPTRSGAGQSSASTGTPTCPAGCRWAPKLGRCANALLSRQFRSKPCTRR